MTVSTPTAVRFHSVRCNPFTHGLDSNGVFAVTIRLDGNDAFVVTDANKVVSNLKTFPKVDALTGHLLLTDDHLTVFFTAQDGESATSLGTGIAVWAGGDEIAFTIVPGVEVTWNAAGDVE